MPRIEILERKIKRLKKAQEEAELLLEKKSRELYDINQHLEKEIRKRVEEFEKARDAAVKANQAKSQFLANMSHEIRTPLNGMIGLLNLLKKSDLEEDQQEYVDIIEQSGNLLLTIINEILEFSKIEAGKLELEYRDFSVRKCIEDIADVLSSEIYKKGLEIPVFIGEEVPHKIYSDEARIRQVLLNLIGNAIKFTPDGEIALSLKTVNGGKSILFEVEDTGIGIPSNKIDAIFQSFSQADISDTRKYGGTGLGLTISKKIISAMKGKIFVESEEGQGSKFSFVVPLEVRSEEALETIVDFDKKIKVVILFKNQKIRENLMRRFNKWNCKVELWTERGDLSSLVDEKGHKTYLIVGSEFIDEEEELTEALRELSSTGKVSVVVSTSPSNKVALKKVFCDDSITVLSKPLKRDELYKTISLEENVCDLEAESPKKLKPHSDLKILLVEDNHINQQVAVAMLASGGYRCKIANNGKEAVDLVEESPFDLILMDCQMPVMDGFDATLAIRKIDSQKNRYTPIIAMTANAFQKTKDQCFEVGMDAFITKPVTPDTLINLIEENLEKAS